VLQLIGFKGPVHLFSEVDAVMDFLLLHFQEMENESKGAMCTMVFVDDELPEAEVLQLIEFLSNSPIAIRKRILAVLMVAGEVDEQHCEFGDLDLKIEVVSKPITKTLFNSLVKRSFFGIDPKLTPGKSL
jgi:hypothetical protein